MIQVSLALLISALATFALLWAFFALVPGLVGNAAPIASFLLQWMLILIVVGPAIVIGIFGPLLFFDLMSGNNTTGDRATSLILGGSLLLILCCYGAARSSAGRRYLSWRSRVA